MTRFPPAALLLGSFLLLPGLGQARAEPTGSATPTARAAYKLANGPHTVQVVKELVLHDARRKKDLKVKIYYPEGKGPFPVVIFSHGFGGTKDVFAYLSRFLASHGYVSIHPSHADAGALHKLKDLEAGLRKSLSDSRSWTERVRDVSFLIDSCSALGNKVPALKGQLDGKRVGVAGHSFGAFTAMLVGGTTVEVRSGQKAQSFRDSRVRAILPISAQGTNHMGLTKTSWDNLKVPMLTVTGTRDRGIGGQDPAWRQEPFKYSRPGDKYLLLIEGANHFSYGGLRLGGGPARASAFVKIAAIAFWDAYLKGDPAARAYLQSDRFSTYGQGVLKFSKK